MTASYMIFPRPDGRWEAMVTNNTTTMIHPVAGFETQAKAREFVGIGPDDPVIGGDLSRLTLWTMRGLQRRVDALWRERDRKAVL